jgi:hypothetical protein
MITLSSLNDSNEVWPARLDRAELDRVVCQQLLELIGKQLYPSVGLNAPDR